MFRKFTLALPVMLGMSLALTGCRYASNRAADFHDIFQAAGGITAENPKTGMIPPSFGAHIQLSEFLNLGAIHFSGLVTESDGRGSFSGFESRTRLGLGPWQRVRIDQDYAGGSENYFKKLGTLWSDRMNSPRLRFANRPAKNLHYESLLGPSEGTPVFHRGWQYWENISLELAISEPFLSHFGFHIRLGFDPSEISDFLLGFMSLDFKHDDLTEAEYVEMVGDIHHADWDYKPSSDAPVRIEYRREETVIGPPPVSSGRVTPREGPALGTSPIVP